MRKKYLFLFTICPVQSFIEQARKTCDLWAGSQILSDLINTGINYVKVNNGENIIIPNPSLDSKPNRFLAIVETNDIKKVGEDIKTATRDKLKEISVEKLKNWLSERPNNFDTQISDYFEIYWAAIPYVEKDYYMQHKEIQRLMGSVKNIRKFNQLQEEGARKCSLDGERNALFYKSALNSKKPFSIQSDAVEIKNSYDLSPGEALSAVSFTKRMYGPNADFPSTAKIALLNVLNKIESKSEHNNFKKEFGNSHFDEQLYFEENLSESYFEKQGYGELINKLPKIQNLHKALFKDIKTTKYYAVLVFDGDSMGKAWSGDGLQKPEDLIENYQRTLCEHFQRMLANMLAEFATKAKEHLNLNEENQKNKQTSLGQSVYAGGDDFLGFVNLRDIFKAMKWLRDQFDKEVFDKVKEKFELKNDFKLTFSAGIAIAHYKTPLSEVLKWAKNMEKEAKEIDENKDAFGIAVLKHSGEIHKTVYKWKPAIFLDNKNEEVWVVDLFDAIINALKDKNGLSNTFIKSLNTEFIKLIDKNGFYSENKVILSEISRLVERSALLSSKDPERKEKIANWTKTVKKLYHTNKSRNLLNFLSALNIADFIHRETGE